MEEKLTKCELFLVNSLPVWFAKSFLHQIFPVYGNTFKDITVHVSLMMHHSYFFDDDDAKEFDC